MGGCEEVRTTGWDLANGVRYKIRNKLWKENRNQNNLKYENLCKLDKQTARKEEDMIEYPHSLIDYRENNAVLKKKSLSVEEAERRNEILKGTGMAWARTGYRGALYY